MGGRKVLRRPQNFTQQGPKALGIGRCTMAKWSGSPPAALSFAIARVKGFQIFFNEGKQ
jgi:hypothetical protein